MEYSFSKDWMISRIICCGADPFRCGREGQLTAQVARWSHTPRLAGRATGSSLCWSMSLEHFLCLLVTWIFHKFRTWEVVLCSGQLTFSHLARMGKHTLHAYMLRFDFVCFYKYWRVSCCWTVSRWPREREREKKKELLSSFVSHCSFHLLLSGARQLRMI